MDVEIKHPERGLPRSGAAPGISAGGWNRTSPASRSALNILSVAALACAKMKGGPGRPLQSGAQTEHQPNSCRSQPTNWLAGGSVVFRSPAPMAPPIFRGAARVASQAWISARRVFPVANLRSAAGMSSM